MYLNGRNTFDALIENIRIEQRQTIPSTLENSSPSRGITDSTKCAFTWYSTQRFADDNDNLLVQYLAILTPDITGRSGDRVYEHLVSHVCLTEHISSD